jgi:hypothetical protein
MSEWALRHLVYRLSHNLNTKAHYLADKCSIGLNKMFVDCSFTTDKITVLVPCN